VVAVAVALGAVAVVAGGETGTTLGIIALVAAIVAIGGRWTTARSERWERTDRPLGKVGFVSITIAVMLARR
jgi:hypothetical protein